MILDLVLTLAAMARIRMTVLVYGAAIVAALAANWPAWNGPMGSGISGETDVPVRWSATDNIEWKVSLPDRGNSSPVVWGDRVFVTQAIEAENRRQLICFDRKDGSRLWEAGLVVGQPEESHPTNPPCSASPVTDGERVVVWFGSAGLFCYDLKGNQLWHRDLGTQKHQWGYGASPILFEDLCILHFGPGERSFLIAVNKRTGETVWKMDLPQTVTGERTDGFARQRNGVVGSWSTPIVIDAADRKELVLSLPERVRAFDPRTGTELWYCEGLNPLVYTSPIYGDGVVVAMGGFLGTTVAVKPGGKGDVTASHRLWQTQRTKNRLGSGVVHDGHVYILNTDGIAECVNLESGERVWDERVRGRGPKSESWSSMVLVGDKIYVLNQSGETIVLRASPKFEVIAVNELDGELTNSTIAVSDGQLFIRTHRHLWCIGKRN